MDIFKILLFVHIVGGSLSLLSGAYILLTRKGGKKHSRLGNVYFICMLTASLVALPMSYIHPNYFLFIIGVFTSYMLISGKRYQTKKTVAHVTAVDWILTLVMLVFGLLFVGFGAFNMYKSNYFGIVFLVFGSIGLLFVYQDKLNFTGKSPIENYGLTTHLQRMTGSYIASATAFLVVNNNILPSIIAWLLPTILLVPLIVSWTKKYKVAANHFSKTAANTVLPKSDV